MMEPFMKGSMLMGRSAGMLGSCMMEGLIIKGTYRTILSMDGARWLKKMEVYKRASGRIIDSRKPIETKSIHFYLK